MVKTAMCQYITQIQHEAMPIQSNGGVGQSKRADTLKLQVGISMNRQVTKQQFHGLCTIILDKYIDDFSCFQLHHDSVAAMNGAVKTLTKLLYVQHHFSGLTFKSLKKKIKKKNLELHEQE